MNRSMVHIARVLLGLFFIASGLAKLIDTQAFVRVAAQYVPANVSAAAVALPPLELVLGLLLMLDLWTRQVAGMVTGFVLLMTALYTTGLLKDGITDCGCFGNVQFMKLPPWGLYLRNAVLVVLSATVAAKAPATGWFEVIALPAGTAKLGAVGLLGAMGFLLAGVSYHRPLFHQRIAANLWGGYPVERTPFAGIPFSADSAYALFLFRPDCTLCKDEVANAASWREAGHVDKVIAVTAASYRKAADSTFRPLFGRYLDRVVYISDARMARAVNYVPTLIVVAGNTVSHVQAGHIPTGYRISSYRVPDIRAVHNHPPPPAP